MIHICLYSNTGCTQKDLRKRTFFRDLNKKFLNPKPKCIPGVAETLSQGKNSGKTPIWNQGGERDGRKGVGMRSCKMAYFRKQHNTTLWGRTSHES